jgi:hypothetical protein
VCGYTTAQGPIRIVIILIIQFFIIYVPSQKPQGQLQTEHSVDTANYIMGNHNKSKTNFRQALEEDTLMQTSKQTNKIIIIIIIK